MAEPLLEARGVVKRFGHVQALQGADFTAFAGEVVALIGDNGAGKSTLVGVLSGVLAPDGGEIRIDGAPVRFGGPQDARRHGLETVYQDLSLAQDLDAPANLYLGRELVRRGLLGRIGVLDRPAMRREAVRAFAELGVTLKDPGAPVASLSGGQRQSVAVARAVAFANRVIFLDEPTAALGVVQRARVLETVRRVADQGICVVLISHNMPEVLSVADRVEVLRLGRRVASLRAADTTIEELVGAMTGSLDRAAESPPSAKPAPAPEPADAGSAPGPASGPAPVPAPPTADAGSASGPASGPALALPRADAEAEASAGVVAGAPSEGGPAGTPGPTQLPEHQRAEDEEAR